MPPYFSPKSEAPICGYCQLTFSQTGSMTRHRDRLHTKNHTCLICVSNCEGAPILGESIKKHLQHAHGYVDVQSCSCCHWIFENKIQLRTHLDAMKATGQPGDEVVLAKGTFAPG